MRLLGWLKGSSDSAASVMVILALVFFVIFGSTFLVIQVSYPLHVLKVKTCNCIVKCWYYNSCKSQFIQIPKLRDDSKLSILRLAMGVKLRICFISAENFNFVTSVNCFYCYLEA